MKLKIPGYTLNEEPIFSGENSIIFSGFEDVSKQNVVLKLLNIEFPTPDQLARFKHEYEISKIFESSKDIVHIYSLAKYGNCFAIVMENVAAPSLGEALTREGKLTPSDFLDLAIEIATALGLIHQHNIIHKDINVNNILCDFDRKKVTIIDFGLSASLPKERADIVNPNVLEGTLEYLSPEQTGRMNRGIDYRTDYYSLGMTFYMMLTGDLPFKNKVPIEIVHCHIAVVPKAPHEIDSKIPKAISDIVMKLIAKTPEERYQSIKGLIYDLTYCRNQLTATGHIDLFQLGTKDLFSRFQISEKLYGRENEVHRLMRSYETIMKGGTELFLIAGYSGIGKSALVHEIHKPIAQKNGYFLPGKFDQFKHNIPYTAFTQAFDELVKQLLAESEERIESFRNAILSAVGENGAIVLELIPSLVSIIGKQPPVLEVGPQESFNRFCSVFKKFIKSIAAEDHPIIIFFDDLQWADLPSIKMIETLLTSYDCHHLMIIGAYRNNEVTETHPLMSMLEELKKQDVIYETIFLAPITCEDINALLADTLHQSTQQTLPLAQLCFEKTGGNPFFLIQLLQTLNKERLIEFDNEKNKWIWHLEKIQKKKITDNIVDLMVGKIRDLSPEAQKILQFAACIGTDFKLDLLSKIDKNNPEKVFSDMQEILNEGYILAHGEAYRSDSFYFVHDRVQQAAASLLDENEYKMTHIELARLMLQMTDQEKLDETIFNITNHYNIGIDPEFHPLIDAAEKKKIAELNLRASRVAITASAFEPALGYIEHGLKCVSEETWESDYSFMLELYNAASESAYLNSKYELLEQYAETAFKHTKNVLDELPIIRTKISSYASQTKLQDGVDIGIQTLGRLGVRIPRHPTALDVLFTMMRTKFFLLGKKILDLLNLPVVLDPCIKATMNLLSLLYSTTYQVSNNLFAYIICTNLILSIRYGNTHGSAYAYSTFGVVPNTIFGDYDGGYQFGELAVKLMEKMHAQEWKTKINVTNNSLLNHWKEPVLRVIKNMDDNFESSVDNGDLEYAGYSQMISFWFKLYFGIPLTEILSIMEKRSSIFVKLKQTTVVNMNAICQQTVLNLIEEKEHPGILIGKAFDEVKMLPILESGSQTILGFLYGCKLFLFYLFEEYSSAAEQLKYCRRYLYALKSMPLIPPFYLYKALTLIATYPASSVWEKMKIAIQIKWIIRKFKHWTKFAPYNQLQRTLIIEAEWAGVSGRKEKASDLYDKAIFTAKKNEFINEEALANELAAKFYLAQGKETIAAIYMQNAHHCYLLWGAGGKVAQLENRYPHLLNVTTNVLLSFRGTSSISERSFRKIQSSISAAHVKEIALDIQTIEKSSQTLSSTIVLEDLLKKLMHIVIENAGAQKAYLLFNHDDKFLVEAEAGINEEGVKVLQSLPITDDILPSSIINYVIHTKESIVIDNAGRSEKFFRDPYILKTQPKSVLCMPLLNQGVLSVVLYMENNSIVGSFTEERIETLKLLSSQIAISINNARLFSQTKALNTRLTLLNQAYERFIPKDFLSLLQKKSIIDVKLGDHTQTMMSVLFVDIRDFTTRSEKISPKENFDFINTFLGITVPIIKKHFGFVDKYIGDAIMALFPRNVDDAIQCGLEMINKLEDYNKQNPQEEAIKIGIGINTGLLMLGIVGEPNRLAATVISDVVNTASRLESLTKNYQTPLLITEDSYKKIHNPTIYEIEIVDMSLVVKGKQQGITIYKVNNRKK